jgi:hypothetical protein
MSITEKQVISLIISSLKERINELDSGVCGPRTLRNFLLSLRDIAFISKMFEVSKIFPYVSFIYTLINSYFNKNVRLCILEMLNTEMDEIPPFVKNMFRREVRALNAGIHFDGDYIPLPSKIEKSLTTFKEYGKNELITKALISLIGDCSEQVVKDLNKKIRNFYNETINALEKNPSLEILKEQVDKFASELHKQAYGW